MIRVVSAKYAFRSLFRHTRRTLLSVVGVGIGCGIALIATSWIGGSTEMQIRAVSESGGGHIRIVPATWPDKRENALRLADWEAALEAAESLPGVKTIAMRARANGLLALGNRTAAVQVTGVEPEVERESNRIVYKASLEGRYLLPDDMGNVVIGKTLAKRLRVELDDDLFVTMVGRDEIQSTMLRIVGILETGSRDLDSTICHVTLSDVNEVSGFSGPAEMSILIDDYRRIDETQKLLAEKLPAGNTVITWMEVNPGLAANVEGDKGFMRALTGAIVLVVLLGIASAQLTAVLERRTEFAILSALGMKSRQVVGLIALEALMVGLGGAAVALVFGGSAAYYLSTEGVNFAALMGDDISFGDVLLDPVMFAIFGPWLIWHALGISVLATVAASIYPAWIATKTDPAQAMRKT
jgi:ABC-type lipoprotein release transport system permease subunit